MHPFIDVAYYGMWLAGSGASGLYGYCFLNLIYSENIIDL
jgi:hypothetical protein